MSLSSGFHSSVLWKPLVLISAVPVVTASCSVNISKKKIDKQKIENTVIYYSAERNQR
jgi:hypothetical protein